MVYCLDGIENMSKEEILLIALIILCFFCWFLYYVPRYEDGEDLEEEGNNETRD